MPALVDGWLDWEAAHLTAWQSPVEREEGLPAFQSQLAALPGLQDHQWMDMSPPGRYDGMAEWYDAHVGDTPSRRSILSDYLGEGGGWCLDVGCGAGRDLQVIAETGRRPVGVELSVGQLGLASGRGDALVQGNAERLPFLSETFPTVISSWTSTDVDDFAATMQENQ